MKNTMLALIALVLLTVTSCKLSKDEKTQRPNILFIMTDDHSFQTLSAYDNRFIQTPHLDRLANDGVLFANSFVANSICAPSRAVMLTGKHSHANGQRTNMDVFDGEQQTFPKLMQEAGYQTALIGKWHLKSDPTGFDYWNILPGQGHYYNPDFIEMGEMRRHEGYVTDLTTDFSIDWLNTKWNRDQSFCLLVHHKAMHRVWMPDLKDLAEFKDVVFPLPETFYDDYRGRRAAALQKMSIREDDMDLVYDLKMADPEGEIQTRLGQYYREGAYGRMTPQQREVWDAHYLPIIEEFKAASLSGDALSEWKYQRYMRDYLACTRSLDNSIGRLIAHLEEMGLLENTLIVYTSDQGFYMGEHGWFDKRFMYEESVRTPLIMRLPKGYARKGEVSEMVQNIDYAPTFLDIAGLDVPQDMQGRSLVALMDSEQAESWRDAIYYHYYEHPSEHMVNRHFGIRNERYKLMRFYYEVDEWEFYDLESDSDEINNLYGNADYEKEIRKMKQELRDIIVFYEDNLALKIFDGELTVNN